MFIDTIKYFQQSLAVLANTVTDKEKQCVKNECKKFIIKDAKLNKKCSVDSQEWVLNYLSSGEGVIPYEMLNRFDSLDISLEEGKFFLPHHFYSSLKETTITTEDYNSVDRDKSKCLIALLTEAEHVKLFEKTMIGGFSSVNTRLAFDSKILSPKDKANDYKLIFDLKINNIYIYI